MAAIPQRMPESPPVDGNKPVAGREVDVEDLCRALTIHSAPRLHGMGRPRTRATEQHPIAGP